MLIYIYIAVFMFIKRQYRLMNRFVSLDVDKDNNNNSSNNKNKCQNLYIQEYSVNPISAGRNIYLIIACLY